jgi:hypothetical protein
MESVLVGQHLDKRKVEDLNTPERKVEARGMLFSSDRDPWREERRGMASADDARLVWQQRYESHAGL